MICSELRYVFVPEIGKNDYFLRSLPYGKVQIILTTVRTYVYVGFQLDVSQSLNSENTVIIFVVKPPLSLIFWSNASASCNSQEIPVVRLCMRLYTSIH